MLVALRALADLENHPGERHAQDFHGAFRDHHAALVAEEALDRQLLRQPHAAMDLYAAVGGPERALIAEDLHHECFLAAVLAAVESPGGVVEHQSELVRIHVDFGEWPLHRLALGEISAEGLALLGIGRAELVATLHHAEAAGAVADAAGVDPGLRLLETVAFVADALPDRHAHVVQHDLAGLVVDHQIVGGGDLHARS